MFCSLERIGIWGTSDVWLSREDWYKGNLRSLVVWRGLVKGEPQMFCSLERIGIWGTSDDWLSREDWYKGNHR